MYHFQNYSNQGQKSCQFITVARSQNAKGHKNVKDFTSGLNLTLRLADFDKCAI